MALLVQFNNGETIQGTLGQNIEVAIKRLGQSSGQGVDEFRNEVVLRACLVGYKSQKKKVYAVPVTSNLWKHA
jgi:hypothetical protein